MTTFFVPGEPIPQGSHKVIRGRIINDNPRLKQWRRTVAQVAAHHIQERHIDNPVTIHAEFVFTRLTRMPKNGDLTKTTKPDVDKLCRALGDALEQSGIIKNDSRITTWHATKRHAAEGENPGAHITITWDTP